MRAPAALAVVILLLVPPAAATQPRDVGVVTTLTGRATVARAALPRPLPLRFRDSIFGRDRVATAERSLLRILLVGRVLVTLRELSVLTVAEDPGRAALDLASGKIALAADHRRIPAGDRLEVRTPNAMALVRGTVLVVEVLHVGVARGAPTILTNLYVISGSVEVLDPADPAAPPIVVGALEVFSRAGRAAGVVRRLPPDLLPRLFSDLTIGPPPGQGTDVILEESAAAERERIARGEVESGPGWSKSFEDGGDPATVLEPPIIPPLGPPPVRPRRNFTDQR